MSLEEVLKNAARSQVPYLGWTMRRKSSRQLSCRFYARWTGTTPIPRSSFRSFLLTAAGWTTRCTKRAAAPWFSSKPSGGGADYEGEEQLFGYAVNKGVPFLILTDGNVWDFYLSMAAGAPAERRFYRAELTRKERIPEYVEFLKIYLRKNCVVSGEARRAAEKRHESNQESKKARRAIPRAWRSLLETPEEMLCDLLAEEVESQCGTKPELDDVEEFLKELLSDAPPRTPDAVSTASRPSGGARSTPVSPQSEASKRSKIVGFILDNERVETGAAKRTLAEILKAFDRRDPGFMERIEAQTVGRTRRLVARNRDDLYDNRPDLVRDYSTDLENGWWLGDNISSRQVRKNVEIACEVAGVNFGSQLTLIER